MEAERFEQHVEGLLRSVGVPFETQEQLVEQQTLDTGRAVATPDFLLLGPRGGAPQFCIQGRPLAWIEAKNFYGASVPMLRKMLAKQCQRYAERYGDGALVFRGGFAHPLAAQLSQLPGAQSRVHTMGLDDMEAAISRWRAMQ